MQLIVYMVIFVVFFYQKAMSSFTCHRCTTTAQNPDMSLEKCSESTEKDICLSSFTQCYQRLSVKKDKTTNKTETVISKGCGNDVLCERFCEPMFFSGYEVISCNMSCCNTTFCNDFKLTTTPPAIVSTIITTTPPANATANSTQPPTTQSNKGNQSMKDSVVSVIISMILLMSFSVVM